MEKVLIDNYEFIKISLSGAEVVVSTAKNNLSFNKATDEGIKNLENIKKWFGVENIGYLHQVHGNDVVLYDYKTEEGDALITNKFNTAIGVFAADCTPILLYDKVNKVVAAVHSGWRGTFSGVLTDTISKMEKIYGSKGENLIICIGPHIHECCYEVSEELIHKFKQSSTYNNINISNGRKLSMKKCIMHQLLDKGICKQNIYDMNICTFCNDEYLMHSYRKNNNGGRLFSFIYLK
ncbi:peptidoglycan editing factor PgeF [Clostridium sp. DJ247]|uniref:peptidoglycan editing factor PgeF n=1 Tax=Clostridium sp. DJ247 TaxID=2726188 RepID=UPI001629DACC|nr:peptidoglycan editing factor PgeF [Clostridium sp. DJ247]MBC2578993.1 peptidoglycan editing factor PgeF [Clostridium sp. DJ247]